MRRRVWQSAVGLLLSRSSGGLTPPEAAAKLAKDLRDGASTRSDAGLEAICRRSGLAIEYEPLATDAVLNETPDGFVAVISSSTSKLRQRFSIAHELGHVELARSTRITQAFGHVVGHVTPSPQAAEVEDLCDFFAAELLMPLAEWQRSIFDEGLSLNVLRRLTHVYRVSVAAAATRAAEAGVWKCAIIIWAKHGDLAKLAPMHFATNISFGDDRWPGCIPDVPEFEIPGSPLYALKRRQETVGEIPLPFEGSQNRLLAQSGIIGSRPARIATLILAEVNGKDILFRSGSKRPSMSQATRSRSPTQRDLPYFTRVARADIGVEGTAEPKGRSLEVRALQGYHRGKPASGT